MFAVLLILGKKVSLICETLVYLILCFTTLLIYSFNLSFIPMLFPPITILLYYLSITIFAPLILSSVTIIIILMYRYFHFIDLCTIILIS